MEEKIISLLNHKLDDLGLWVDNVKWEMEGSNNYLRICLDSKDIIDVNLIVEATKIIDPLIDKENIINEQYILDIYGKSKGE